MADNSVNVTDLEAENLALRAKLTAAENERTAAENERTAAENELAATKESLRLTSLIEYLDIYQKLFAQRLQFDAECDRNTKGGITSPIDRITPDTISPWTEFDTLQDSTYGDLCGVLQSDHLFPNETYIRLGAVPAVQDFLITSEDALKEYVNLAEVTPVKDIICQYLTHKDNGMNATNVRYTSRRELQEDTQTKSPFVDGLWHHVKQGSNQQIAIVELKPPHKLTTDALKEALNNGEGRAETSFDTKPIINSPHVTDDSRYTITAVFTQVFDYMINSGLEYAYLNTGMACVFFRIDEAKPTILYYSLHISPRTGIAEAKRTAVCQIALFLCRCLKTKTRNQEWITEAFNLNARFCVDVEAQLRMMSTPSPSASEMITPGKDDYKPPRKRRRQSSCERDRSTRGRGEDSDDDADDPSPTRYRQARRLRATTAEHRTQQDAASSSTTSVDHRQHGAGFSQIPDQESDGPCTPSTLCAYCPVPGSPRPYCTQACLQGLTNGLASGLSRALDMRCPNADQHSLSSEHELTAEALRDSLRRQLAWSRDHALDLLNIRGAIGHLFRVSLCSHGYTFVAKAVRADHVCALTRECAIYEKLRDLQAQYIPVCLGLIQLEKPYILPFPNHLTHFLLLSYSGTDLSSRTAPHLLPEGLSVSADATRRKLRARGLRHHDSRKENMLWNTELHRVFVIDFERSDYPGVPPAPGSPKGIHIPPKEISNPAIDRVKRQSGVSGKRKMEGGNEHQRKRRLTDIDVAAAREEIMQ